MNDPMSVIQCNVERRWKESKQTKEGGSEGVASSEEADGSAPRINILPIGEEAVGDSSAAEYLEVFIKVEESDTMTKDQIASLENEKFQSSELVCELCSKVFTTRQHLERHRNTHSKDKLFPCPECDKVLLDKDYLARHMKSHSGDKTFECPSCDKKFCTLFALKRHQSNHDPSLRPHVCSECGKRFPDNSSLRKHVRIHSRVKNYICTICAKGFTYVSDLNTHLKYHDFVKEFRCAECGKEFSRNNNLIRHKAVHSGNGIFKCTICSVSFQHAATLTRHVLSCHPGEVKVKKKKIMQAESTASEKECESSTSIDEETIPHVDAEPSAQCFNPIESDKDVAECNNSKEIHNSSVLNDNSSIEQIETLNATPPTFEVYQIDASGSLVRVTDAGVLKNLSYPC